MKAIIPQPYRLTSFTWAGVFLPIQTRSPSGVARQWAPTVNFLESGTSCCFLKRLPLLHRQVTQTLCDSRLIILPAVSSSMNLDRLSIKCFDTLQLGNAVSTRDRTFGWGQNFIPLKRNLTKTSKSKSQNPSTIEERKQGETTCLKDEIGDISKGTGTRPLNLQATKAIISQLSSPPNLLTLSRILATPYLSYMLISENHKRMQFTMIEGGDTIALAASTQYPIPSEIVHPTIDIFVEATPSIFANVDTPEMALLVFIAMGFTDFLDGYIARVFPSTATVLGTYLDPIADKIFISTLALTLWYIGSLPGPLVGLWVTRDIGIIGSVYYLVRKETIRGQSNKRCENDRDKIDVAIMDPQNTPLKVQASFTSKVNTTLQIGLIALAIANEVPSIEVPPMLMTSMVYITAGTTIGSSLGYLDGSAMKNTGKYQ